MDRPVPEEGAVTSGCARFVNLFSYECKVSFFTCYANAWVDLIPWLRKHRGLDKVSERFLRFWHNQNPSTGGADGRDAFNGQVLALHPLSGFFMKDPRPWPWPVDSLAPRPTTGR